MTALLHVVEAFSRCTLLGRVTLYNGTAGVIHLVRRADGGLTNSAWRPDSGRGGVNLAAELVQADSRRVMPPIAPRATLRSPSHARASPADGKWCSTGDCGRSLAGQKNERSSNVDKRVH
jgi:hypothetical protein